MEMLRSNRTPNLSDAQMIKRSLVKWVVLFALVLLSYTAADACRDCPFPLHVIEKGHWINEKSNVEVLLDSTRSQGKMIYIHIVIRDMNTKQIVAEGQTSHLKTSRTLQASIIDSTGRPLNVVFKYNPDTQRVSMAVRCATCQKGEFPPGELEMIHD